MKNRGFLWMVSAAFVTTMLGGCASDDLILPEADLETPGAFVAVNGYDVDNEITLIRTIDRLVFENETLLFFSVYNVTPGSWEEAGELSKRPKLPLRAEIDAQPIGAITEHPWRVVWFRTLTEAEEGRVQ